MAYILVDLSGATYSKCLVLMQIEAQIYLLCYVKCVTVGLWMKPTATKGFSQNWIVWLFNSL